MIKDIALGMLDQLLHVSGISESESNALITVK